MPHAVNADEEQDDQTIQSLFDPTSNTLGDLLERPLERGEKADDAQDFEDLADDDLASDEDVNVSDGKDAGGGLDDLLAEGTAQQAGEEGDLDDLDDLFNERSTSPQDGNADESRFDGEDTSLMTESPTAAATDAPVTSSVQTVSNDVAPALEIPGSEAPSQVQPSVETDEDVDPQWLEQQQLFAEAREGRHGVPDVPLTTAEMFNANFPSFKPDEPLRFGELLPVKRAFYIPKAPLKPPKPLVMNKVTLEIAPDTERSFRLPGLAKSTKAERRIEAAEKGLVLIEDEEDGELSSDDGFDMDETIDPNESVAGHTMRDIEMICTDWSIPSKSPTPVLDFQVDTQSDIDLLGESEEDDAKLSRKRRNEDYEGPAGKRRKATSYFHDIEQRANERPLPPTDTAEILTSRSARRDIPDTGEDVEGPQRKRRKTTSYFQDIDSKLNNQTLPLFDNAEELTAKQARQVHLDLNDPNLLLDVQQPSAASKKTRKLTGEFNFDRNEPGSFTNFIKRRYNHSNDEAYELLKENHQHKIRSTLGNLSIDHSLPAVKLQYPYYKVKLSAREARAHHRPFVSFAPGQVVAFEKARSLKRKHLKGKPAEEVYATSQDLSLGDNCNILLLEYSEEYPTILSNFGMGNRVINYYRRKDIDDASRPKLDIGETAVLLPQDKSPFSIFGNIDPGQQVPTLHNGMYRAPIFKQDPKSTDFLVARTTTGVDGTTYHLRNFGSVAVVGQEFPSVEVPGTHSRKVTDAAKRRLKAFAFRMLKRHGTLTHQDIIGHNPGSDIPQNRSKMKEFMVFEKDRGGNEKGSWQPKKGEGIPDVATIRSWIKPEDVCLLESMQVGHRHLLDSGYNADAEEDSDQENEGDSMEKQLAPWQTSKNFLNACQGKAMLQLHGEGDPTGRGEGFSFIRTSMKGGFKAIGESVEDKLDAKRQKELGGHSYNVARQQRAYEEAIRRIWTSQMRSLSSTVEHSDTENDGDDSETEASFTQGASQTGTPAPAGRADIETGSQYSMLSKAGQSGKVLKITRTITNKHGHLERREEIVQDQKIIKEYLRRKRAEEDTQIS